MKRFLILFLFVLALVGGLNNTAAAKGWYYQGLTGGGATDMDGEDGAKLTDGDLGLVADGIYVYFYRVDANSGLTESSPNIIAPDTNPGDIRWILQEQYNVISGVHPPSGVSITGGIAGIVLANNTTDSDHDIDVSAGACLDSTGIYHITLAAGITKSIDATWAADNGDSTPEGGLLNGSVAADTLYNVYLLRDNADGTADVGFLAYGDSIATYKPTGYDYYRWTGWVNTDALANIRNFAIAGNVYEYSVGFLALNDFSNMSYELKDLSSILPAGHVQEFRPGWAYVISSSSIQLGITTGENSHYWTVAESSPNWGTDFYWYPLFPDATFYLKTLVGHTTDMYLKAVKFIR